PLIIIAALVWLALQTLGSHGTKQAKETYSQLLTRVQAQPDTIQSVTFVPNKQEIDATISEAGQQRKVVVHYATDQAQYGFQQALQAAQKQNSQLIFDSKGVGSSPWWSILTSLLPFVLLFGFWIFLMNQVQGGGSKVMSFGKSRAKRMTPDSPKIGFKDVAGVDEAVEELQEIKEFLENPKKFQALGARIPKGVLLYGPPRTGPTSSTPHSCARDVSTGRSSSTGPTGTAAGRSSRCTRRASRSRPRSTSTRSPPARRASPAPTWRTSSTRPLSSRRGAARR